MNEQKKTLRKQLASYFAELEATEAQIRELIQKQQAFLAGPTPAELESFSAQEQLAVTPLKTLIQKREELLQSARLQGIPAQNLRELAGRLGDSQEATVRRAQQLQMKIYALHQASQSLWITCQKSVLHYGQLVQLIAAGGRKPLILSTGKTVNQGGAILDATV